MSGTWIDDDTWSLIQDLVPILCVDVVPVTGGHDAISHFGLIRRLHPSQGQEVFCQIGGRVNRLETVRDAVIRHVTAALPDLEFDLPADPQPDYVMQWFPHADLTRFGEDPRKHAVALSFRLKVLSQAHPRAAGEAESFSWFEVDDLPSPAGTWPGTNTLLKNLLLLERP